MAYPSLNPRYTTARTPPPARLRLSCSPPAIEKLHGGWGFTPAVAGAAAPPCRMGSFASAPYHFSQIADIWAKKRRYI